MLFESFKAFNINAFNHIAYTVKENWWLVLLAAAAVLSMVLYLKDESATHVVEEQQIL